MANKRLNDLVLASVAAKFEVSPTSVTRIGSSDRPNSWTFKIVSSGEADRVIKIAKPPRRGTRDKEEAERELIALRKIAERSDINVVKMLDNGQMEVDGDSFDYIVFPFIQGTDLQARNKTVKDMSEDDVAEFTQSIAKTIVQLAEVGLKHQDIKPANILVTDEGKYVVLDMGIAQPLGTDVKDVKLMGPARYLSPEQVALASAKTPPNQRTISFISDFFSLGVIVIELITGEDFPTEWSNAERPFASAAVREGTGIIISDPGLRELVASLVEINPSVRLMALLNLIPSLTEVVASPTDKLPTNWALRHSQTKAEIVTRYAADYPKVKGGVIMLADLKTTQEKASAYADELKSLGWKIIMDPMTFRLEFDAHHHSYLKNRDFYSSEIESDFAVFMDPKFKADFVRDCLGYQLEFKPDVLISPYFVVRDPNDAAMSLNFGLYEEAKSQLKEQGTEIPLAFGISTVASIIGGPRLTEFLDQIVMRKEFDLVYMRPELIKNDNAPCKDPVYLAGLLKLSKTLSATKQLLLVRVDQAILGILANSNASFAINPYVAARKNDIITKYNQPKGKGGGPTAENQYKRYYVEQLMTDLDVSRQMSDSGFQKLSIAHKLACKCRYCSGLSLTDLLESDPRYLHFMQAFETQVQAIEPLPMEQRPLKFKEMIGSASLLYAELLTNGTVFPSDANSDHLAAWNTAFFNGK